MQYEPYVRAIGVNLSFSCLFNDWVVQKVYSRSRLLVLWRSLSIFRRIVSIARAIRYDLVWLEKELIPFFPSIFERALRVLRTPIIVDYDDAIFHNYDQHPSMAVRRLYSNKIRVVMRSADVVSAGNEYLARYAKEAGARRVELFPTVVDTHRYPVLNLSSQRNPVQIVWIGTPYTAKYLRYVARALAVVQRDFGAKIVLIGAGDIGVQDFAYSSVKWMESTEAQEISVCDIGIMPLPDEAFEHGKCGYKLIQYMACGLPVVASPIGVNVSIVRPGVNGFLAGNSEEWIKYLRELILKPELRRSFGLNGRRLVEREFSLEVMAPRIGALILECAVRRKEPAHNSIT